MIEPLNEKEIADITSPLARDILMLRRLNQVISVHNKTEEAIKELAEEVEHSFNERFRYFAGKPMEGSLELTHNNVRDFMREIIQGKDNTNAR